MDKGQTETARTQEEEKVLAEQWQAAHQIGIRE